MARGADPKTLAQVEVAFDGSTDHGSEIRYRRKDGSIFWAAIFVSPVLDESGELIVTARARLASREMVESHSALAGVSMEEMVFRSVFSCRNAEMQREAQALGGISKLTPLEIQKAGAFNLEPRPIARAWEYWCRDAAGRGARKQTQLRQDARGQRPHDGILPPTGYRRKGPQLGTSRRLVARQRVRDRSAGLRAWARAHAGAWRTDPSAGQPGAGHAMPADVVRSDLARAREVVPARDVRYSA